MTEEAEIDKILDLAKKLVDSGLLDVAAAVLDNKEEILSEIADWLQNNGSLLKNFSTVFSALSKLDPDTMRKARGFRDLVVMLNDPDVMAGLSFLLNFMKAIGESLHE
ncbi:hypothetical protein GCM10007981_07880 [Thermocladium modestius]|uniref:DUF1641 domain-containing protein n=1 Tax=Thermocladium modestius TaxID=62609 RepID=A0A830GV75_9CREN|nr:DUF1641 domain-containing protein [Thermocladium modestius]GGP20312.1 hypothetical protein GCM10007981_07880 [Thermocladium modestius]